VNQNLVKKWLVVQIKPNSYDLAVRNLQRQGFETFLPKMKTTIKTENKFINKNVLVFPGYVFVGVEPQNFNWNKINNTYGVARVLAFNSKPALISIDLIIALKNRYETNINPIIEESLNKGDTIRFNHGPFVNLIARIEALDDKNRIVVILQALGENRRVKIQQAEKMNFTKF
jgi:transcriptional antiterminator RfaH